ncbi:non-hydrolyzing UDP-N-acetylglucosamine 2-epimerase [Legionella sainthelensi]|uniref:non-hydrolyzing UDP-N-acetylglucosamine 2-epimerase n=1 Tax=Legionella sainthelensi TaxID=28087 RepID=UPI000E20C6D7|nr:UDP-N-acetylglucosamine 2-epimerase (non-hydrolyzing) [Legionella sainthelensi]
MVTKKIICVIGTRPEVIKMAPVVMALKEQKWASTYVLATAQHREMLDQMLALFNIKPDFDLNIMRPNQSLSNLTSKLMDELDNIFRAGAYDLVLAQGDTTSTLASALAAFYLHIPFYHVEAGLRSGNIRHPFPEEMNRLLVTQLAALHFAPTVSNKNNLMAAGISENTIYVTGNTVIDALHYISKKPIQNNLHFDKDKRLILVTSHRRENFGKPFQEICAALRKLVAEFDDIEFLFPVHPNPNVTRIAYQELGDISQIHLTPPLDYNILVHALNQSYLVLTDSGGIQEEAPALGKPVLILRETTERTEVIEAGVGKLVPLNAEDIFRHTAELLRSKEKYNNMVKTILPYGDGTAAQKIVEIIKNVYFL